MQEEQQGTQEAQVVHYAKAHVGARDRRRQARTPEERARASREEYTTGNELDKAVRRLKPP